MKSSSASYRELLRIALPLIVTSASFSIMHFCDRMFLGWYSPEALQAAVPSGIFFFTFVCGFMALAAFANSFVAQYYGNEDYHGCSLSVAQALYMVLFSIPLIWALIPLGLWLFSLAGHAPEVLIAEKKYFTILMIGGGAVPLNAAIGSFFSGRGRTRVIMGCALLSTSLNLLLDRWLIFGGLGIAPLGIAGAAIASAVAACIGPGVMLGLYFGAKNNRAYETRRLFYLDGPLFRRMLRFGIPAGVHMVLEIGAFSLFTLLVGRLGETAFLAANIALSVNLVAFLPATGIGQAAGVMVGQYLGRGDPEGAMQAGWKAVHVGWVYTLLIVSTYFIIPDVLIRLFAPDAELFADVFETARTLLALAAGWGLMDATALILSGSLRGAGDTKFVMWYQTSIAWGLFAVGELVIILYLRLGVLAAWVWALIYIALLSVGMVLRFRSGRWQNIELIERRSLSGR